MTSITPSIYNFIHLKAFLEKKILQILAFFLRFSPKLPGSGPVHLELFRSFASEVLALAHLII